MFRYFFAVATAISLGVGGQPRIRARYLRLGRSVGQSPAPCFAPKRCRNNHSGPVPGPGGCPSSNHRWPNARLRIAFVQAASSTRPCKPATARQRLGAPTPRAELMPWRPDDDTHIGPQTNKRPFHHGRMPQANGSSCSKEIRRASWAPMKRGGLEWSEESAHLWPFRKEPLRIRCQSSHWPLAPKKNLPWLAILSSPAPCTPQFGSWVPWCRMRRRSHKPCRAKKITKLRASA